MRFWILLGGGVALALAGLFWLGTPQGGSDSSDLSVELGGKGFTVEMLTTRQAREQGMSGRPALPAGHGLLFVFPDSRRRAFWMRQCRIPLDIAFLDGSGRVLHTATMAVESPDTPPEKLRRYSCPKPTRYVLEISAGQLRQLGVGPGAMVRLPAGIEKIKAER